jgi:hypothetical protein
MASPRCAAGRGGARPGEQPSLRGLAGTLAARAADVLPPAGDDDFVVFCFARPEAAQAFAERFGGECLATAGNWHLRRYDPAATSLGKCF